MKRPLSILFLFLSACGSSSTGPTAADFNGSHALAKVNGQPLPVRTDEIPLSKTQPASGCFREVRNGRLDISGSTGAGTFQYSYDAWNTCTNVLIGVETFSGEARMVGTVLALRSVASGAPTWTDTVRVVGQTLQFDSLVPKLAFVF